MVSLILRTLTCSTINIDHTPHVSQTPHPSSCFVPIVHNNGFSFNHGCVNNPSNDIWPCNKHKKAFAISKPLSPRVKILLWLCIDSIVVWLGCHLGYYVMAYQSSPQDIRGRIVTKVNESRATHNTENSQWCLNAFKSCRLQTRSNTFMLIHMVWFLEAYILWVINIWDGCNQRTWTVKSFHKFLSSKIIYLNKNWKFSNV